MLLILGIIALFFACQTLNKLLVKYTYADSVTTKHGEHKLVWNKFPSNEEGAWQFIMLMKPEIPTDNSGLTHFHFCYGNERFAALEKIRVFLTIFAPTTTAEQFTANFAE